MKEGPTKIVKYVCKGCKYLHLEDWKYYDENDYVERGVDATCSKVNQNITSYYVQSQHSPDYCPYLKETFGV